MIQRAQRGFCVHFRVRSRCIAVRIFLLATSPTMRVKCCNAQARHYKLISWVVLCVQLSALSLRWAQQQPELHVFTRLHLLPPAITSSRPTSRLAWIRTSKRVAPWLCRASRMVARRWWCAVHMCGTVVCMHVYSCPSSRCAQNSFCLGCHDQKQAYEHKITIIRR